ncbi:MAG: hypothetical protein CME52_06025 [Halieaceae bacterium]|nr:hypothetical protein [Halieaceae bacterium]PDH38859.1 MAG: hypothetical protein CNE43_01720 [Halieaceae bacterium MED-G26]RPG89828.1 MAG: DUF1643 domain-containing protein [Cellvibrionales bacterium TMED157]
MKATATFSDCGRYRYRLERRWAPGPVCVFVGLNPSTATARSNDATVRKCVSLARSWGFSGITMANLFAIRCRYPQILSTHRDPVGPENDQVLMTVIGGAQTVVAMWGNQGLKGYGLGARRDSYALSLHNHWQCIGITMHGAPRHPLYAAKTSALIPFANTP